MPACRAQEVRLCLITDEDFSAFKIFLISHEGNTNKKRFASLQPTLTSVEWQRVTMTTHADRLARP